MSIDLFRIVNTTLPVQKNGQPPLALAPRLKPAIPFQPQLPARAARPQAGVFGVPMPNRTITTKTSRTGTEVSTVTGTKKTAFIRGVSGQMQDFQVLFNTNKSNNLVKSENKTENTNLVFLTILAIVGLVIIKSIVK